MLRPTLKVLGVDPHETGWAALLFVLPGMTGEILALLNPSVLLPGMHPESVVTYAALLFAGYSAIGYYALYRQQRARASGGGRTAEREIGTAAISHETKFRVLISHAYQVSWGASGRIPAARGAPKTAPSRLPVFGELALHLGPEVGLRVRRRSCSRRSRAAMPV
jgi:hypothetical protein